MVSIRNIVKDLQNRFFDSIVSNRLVYNTCWEDPRIDRTLLEIDAESTIVMLTSAGCNALDYLLDNPKKIHTVDRNPAQNALLELKIALFRHGDYDLLFDLFGRGHHPEAPWIYRDHLRTHLTSRAQTYWDQNINYFSRSTNASSFYFRGTSGRIAQLTYSHIRRKGLFKNVLKLLESDTLAEQRYYFEEIEPEFWSGFYRWLLNRNTTMALLGVPVNQRNLVEKSPDDGLEQFVRQSMRHIFTQLPVKDNYFWRVYLTGSYTQHCCPNYLGEEHFHTLAGRIDQIDWHTSTLSNFLSENPGSYSHFVLLDHQDWLAGVDRPQLEKEWDLILRNSCPGTRILFRSAAEEAHFLPSFVHDHLTFQTELTQDLHQIDRVGTYGSTHLGIVEKPIE